MRTTRKCCFRLRLEAKGRGRSDALQPPSRVVRDALMFGRFKRGAGGVEFAFGVARDNEESARFDLRFVFEDGVFGDADARQCPAQHA